jgi:hypothetical protein
MQAVGTRFGDRDTRERGADRDAPHGAKNGREYPGPQSQRRGFARRAESAAKDTTTLEGLKSRLEAVNTEANASFTELVGKFEHTRRGIITSRYTSRYDELQFV